MDIDDYLLLFLQHSTFITPALLIFLEESGIPLPIPGDLIIAYSGYLVSKGVVPYVVMFLLHLIAVLIGSSVLYYLSERWGQQLILSVGKYIHLSEKRLNTVEAHFKKYGPLVIIIGRHIPGFRVPITVFSAISEITYKTFIISTLVSVVVWIPFYLSAGAKLGPRTVHLFRHFHHAGLFSIIASILIILIFVILVRNRGKKQRSS